MVHFVLALDRRSRGLGAALVAASILVAAGCGPLEHARTVDEYARRSLSTQSASGTKRLQIESDYDGSVRDFIERHGRPDYLYVADRNRLYLYYTPQDMAAIIIRDLLPPGKVTKMGRIPGSLLTLLPPREIDRILTRRAIRKEQRERRVAATRRGRADRSRPPPAAPLPTPREDGWSSRGFDVDAIVARLRVPMSAADPGVSGWRRGGSVGGTAVRTARSGNTRYEVLPDRVTVAIAIANRSVGTPPRLRVACVRINNAIFGTRASGVSGAVEPLVERVSRDPSGRTRILRRIAGRTVNVKRIPGQGLLVYSVHAD